MTAAGPARAASPWFRYFAPRPGADLRLVCFPHAGGSVTTFRGWPALLPGLVELVAVQYPGRQDRYREPCFEEMDPLAGEIAAAVLDLLPGPLAFFGHSMGAAVAFEVARRLQEHGREPVRLFVSARSAPTRTRPDRLPIHSDEELLAYLHALGGGAAHLLEHDDLRELTLPMVRSDLRLIEAYACADGPPLRCPITAIVGAADDSCTAADVAGWRAYTAAGFELHTFPGGHFYLEPVPAQLPGFLLDRLPVRPGRRSA